MGEKYMDLDEMLGVKKDESVEVPEEVKEESKPEKEEDEPRKNRHHRRVEEQLEREREGTRFLNEKILELTSSQRMSEDLKEQEMPTDWLALYGDAPESKKAWAIQRNLYEQAAERGKKEALQEFEERQRQELEEARQAEQHIDDALISIEENYDVDITSNSPKARKMRSEYLELVKDVSSKDSDGNITAYADFDSTFELYQKTKTEPKEDNSRQKEIAARSMQSSSQGYEKPLEGPMTFERAKAAIQKMTGY